MLIASGAAGASAVLDVGGLRLISFFFGIPPQKGDRKSYAAREIGKTGLRVAAVGCECMGGESLRLQFGTGLKSGSEFTEPMERVGRSPAPFEKPVSQTLRNSLILFVRNFSRFLQTNLRFPLCYAGGNA